MEAAEEEISTDPPIPAGSVRASGVDHAVWHSSDLPLGAMGRYLRAQGGMVELRGKGMATIDEPEPLYETVAALVPTLDIERLRKMRGLDFMKLFARVMAASAKDPSRSRGSEATGPQTESPAPTPSSESASTQSEPASPRRSAGRSRKSTR